MTDSPNGQVAILNEAAEVVAIDKVTPHPDNPRQGDVGAIHESFMENGFYGALIVQRSTGRILAGNHRYLAARDAGMTEVPVFYVDVDDDRALRILLADNRTNDLATYDDPALINLLRGIAEADDGFLGTGWDGEDLDTLIYDATQDLKLPTQDEIDKKQGENDDRFADKSKKDQNEYVDLVCPECSSEFSIRVGDIGKESTT